MQLKSWAGRHFAVAELPGAISPARAEMLHKSSGRPQAVSHCQSCRCLGAGRQNLNPLRPRRRRWRNGGGLRVAASDTSARRLGIIAGARARRGSIAHLDECRALRQAQGY